MAKQKHLLIGVFAFIIVVGSVLIVVASFSTTSKRPTSQTTQTNQTCPAGQRAVHQVVIQNGLAVPSSTTALLCDTLTITNLDNKTRLMAFGPHEDHVPYDGVGEKALGKDESLTVTLVQAGSFRFHDHIDDQAQGTFTVTNN